MIPRLCAVALLVLAASCGHKDNSQATTSTTTTTVQTPSAAAPVGAVATNVPATSNAANPPGFNDEKSAQAHCVKDEVVWLNTRSKIYHEKGTRYYGTTKQGEYACRHEADAAGDRNSKS